LNDATKNYHTIKDENELKDDTYRLAHECEILILKIYKLNDQKQKYKLI